MAGNEEGIIHPFIEAGITRDEIQLLLVNIALSSEISHSMPVFGTRVP